MDSNLNSTRKSFRTSGGTYAPSAPPPPTCLKDIECPVCFHEINSVPIYQCRNGHVVCKECHPKLKNCPICRELYDGPIRNLKLEEIVRR